MKSNQISKVSLCTKLSKMSIKQLQFTIPTPLFPLSNCNILDSPSQLQHPARLLPNLHTRQIFLFHFLIVPHKTNPLLNFLSSPKNLSLQTHFAEKISSCIDSLQGVKTASQLIFFESKLFHFLNQTGHHNQIHRSREDKEDQSRQQMQVGETDLLLLPKYSLKVFVLSQGRIGNLHLNRER